MVGVVKIDTPFTGTSVEFTAKPPPPDDVTPPEVNTVTTVPKAPKPGTNLGDTVTRTDLFDPAEPVLPDVPRVVEKRVVDKPVPVPTYVPAFAVPRGNSARWITTNDYPARPLRGGIEGVASYLLVVGTNGKVNACEITATSGNRQLDAATCKHLKRRARFNPAKDQLGNEIVGTYHGSVSWQIPD